MSYKIFLDKCLHESFESANNYYVDHQHAIDICDGRLLDELCKNNCIDIIKWLYNMDNTIINNVCFLYSDINSLKILYELNNNMFVQILKELNHFYFRRACEKNYIGHANLFKDIMEKNGKVQYNFIIDNDKIIDFWVTGDIDINIFRFDELTNLSHIYEPDIQYINICNEYEILEKIQSIALLDSTCNISNKQIVNKMIRNSKTSAEKININIKNIQHIKKYFDQCSEFCVDDKFDYVEYNVGEKFDFHVDSSQPFVINNTLKKSNYTVLLYPPQNIIGGELVIKTNNFQSLIKMHTHKWTIVFLPINVIHSSLKIVSGFKKTFKGCAYINIKLPQHKPCMFDYRDVGHFT